MELDRRGFVICATAWLASAGLRAAPRPRSLQERLLANRLELWANYAQKTRNLVARYTSTRTSSLLYEPLVTTGTLVLIAPDMLAFHDDGMQGAITRIEGSTAEIEPRRTDLPGGVTFDTSQSPAAAWLRERLLRLFSAEDDGELIENSRPHVPPGKGYRLELYPPRNSVIRKTLRGLTIRLDSVAGAVQEITLSEAQGDQVHIELVDHRQNVEPAELRQVTQRADTRPDANGDDEAGTPDAP